MSRTLQSEDVGRLVISRDLEQSIRIGKDVEVKVIAVLGNKVRLLVTAPKSVPVHRTEVTQREDFQW